MRPRSSIVTTASSAASSIARSRDSLARTSSSARRLATNCPTSLPSTRIVQSTRSSGSRSLREKNSITPTTPRGLLSGNPKAAWSPLRLAASARGKFASSGTSEIQIASSRASTRPGRPPRGARRIRPRSGSTAGAPPALQPRRPPAAVPGADAAEPLGLGVDLPDRAELPPELFADRLKHGGVDLDRVVLFREDPGDRVLDALKITRLGKLSARPLDVGHRYH